MNLDSYQQFTNTTASEETLLFDKFIERIKELQSSNQSYSIQRLLTAGIGITSEAGEFSDIVKKIFFQKKNLSSKVRDEMIKELGDVLWYLSIACTSLGVTLNEVMEHNVSKLKNRYGTSDKT